MDLDKQEYEQERIRRKFIKHTWKVAEGKVVQPKEFKQFYSDYCGVYDTMCDYMDSYNKEVKENMILNEMVKLMAQELTTPINKEKWIIEYYRDIAVKKLNM